MGWMSGLVGGGLGLLFGKESPDYPKPTPEELEIRKLLYEWAKAGIPKNVLATLYERLTEQMEDRQRLLRTTFGARGLRTTGLLTEQETELEKELGKRYKDIQVQAELLKPEMMSRFLNIPRPERLGQYGAELGEAQDWQQTLMGIGTGIGDWWGRRTDPLHKALTGYYSNLGQPTTWLSGYGGTTPTSTLKYNLGGGSPEAWQKLLGY